MYRAHPTYFDHVQSEVSYGMRAMLIDWLIDVAMEYQLHSQTIFLTVNYIDRYLSKVNIKRDVLQLVGVACMFIASKFEEIQAPLASEFSYITDHTYSVTQILRVEQNILGVLGFHLMATTPIAFLDAFTTTLDLPEDQVMFVRFVVERFMQEKEYLYFLPSQICAAAVAYSNIVFGRPSWPAEAVDASGLSKSDIKECFQSIQYTHLKAESSSLVAVITKYSSDAYMNVGKYVPSFNTYNVDVQKKHHGSSNMR